MINKIDDIKEIRNKSLKKYRKLIINICIVVIGISIVVKFFYINNIRTNVNRAVVFSVEERMSSIQSINQVLEKLIIEKIKNQNELSKILESFAKIYSQELKDAWFNIKIKSKNNCKIITNIGKRECTTRELNDSIQNSGIKQVDNKLIITSNLIRKYKDNIVITEINAEVEKFIKRNVQSIIGNYGDYKIEKYTEGKIDFMIINQLNNILNFTNDIHVTPRVPAEKIVIHFYEIEKFKSSNIFQLIIILVTVVISTIIYYYCKYRDVKIDKLSIKIKNNMQRLYIGEKLESKFYTELLKTKFYRYVINFKKDQNNINFNQLLAVSSSHEKTSIKEIMNEAKEVMEKYLVNKKANIIITNDSDEIDGTDVLLFKLIIYSVLHLSVTNIQKDGIIKFTSNKEQIINKEIISVKVIDDNKYKALGNYSKHHHIYLNEEELKVFIKGIGGKITFGNLNTQGAIIEANIPINLNSIIESSQNKKIINLDEYKKDGKNK